MSFPALAGGDLDPTRDALHAYARLMGDWLKQCRPRRKHWWHASLRPSLRGLTTGVVDGNVAFELELNLADSALEGRTSSGATLSEPLRGQSALILSDAVARFLANAGVKDCPASAPTQDRQYRYSGEHARAIGAVLRTISATMSVFRAGIREETSPIQFWPHHFDLSMLWLPGEKISAADPADEESSDKQMNFGFTFGDASIPEPYFYITTYPTPPAMSGFPLTANAYWHTDTFTGAVLPYARLCEQADPAMQLLTLWRQNLNAGQTHLRKASS